jgi:hypothetical protein
MSVGGKPRRPGGHEPPMARDDMAFRISKNRIGKRLGDLARDPLRGWLCRHAKRHPKPSSVAHNDKTIQNLECDRRQDKEVDRRDAEDVTAEKRPPALRRWPRVAAHVPSDRRLGDLEAELEQACAAQPRPSVCQHGMHRIWVDGTEFRWTREVAARG